MKLESKYVLGIEEIDEQHQKLVDIGNELLELADLGDGIDRYDEIMAILHKLRDYTEYHFKSEERLFVDLDYDNKDVHKMEHEFFLKKVDKFFDKDMDVNQSENLKQLTNFVMGWVLHHILSTDNEYAEIINS